MAKINDDVRKKLFTLAQDAALLKIEHDLKIAEINSLGAKHIHEQGLSVPDHVICYNCGQILPIGSKCNC